METVKEILERCQMYRRVAEKATGELRGICAGALCKAQYKLVEIRHARHQHFNSGSL